MVQEEDRPTIKDGDALTCTVCGLVGDSTEFMDEDEFFSCPECHADDSAIEKVEE